MTRSWCVAAALLLIAAGCGDEGDGGDPPLNDALTALLALIDARLEAETAPADA